MAKKQPMFWWEDGYNREEAMKAEQNTEKLVVACDGYGGDFQTAATTTNLHHLDGLFFNKSNRFALLNEPGGRGFKKNSSITIYDLRESKNEFVVQKSFLVGDNSGFFSISGDDSIVAVGVLKEDTVMIFEIETGDNLLNLTGGQKMGYFGRLSFPLCNDNNSLFESRVTEMRRGQPVKSMIRLWDLGFKNKSKNTILEEEQENGNNIVQNDGKPTATSIGNTDDKAKSDDSDSDSDDDEEEVKLWEKKKVGAVDCQACGLDLILCTLSTAKKMEWLERPSGSLHRSVHTGDKWTAKSVVSTNKEHVAVSHFGTCSVWSVAKGDVVAEVACPDPTDAAYPLVPLCFVGSEDEWLLLRINQDRCLLLCDWRGSKDSMIAIRHVGGTISDDCVALSSDESRLVCWPFGTIEMFSFSAIKYVLHKKINQNLRNTCVHIRELVKRKRAEVSSESNAVNPVFKRLAQLENADVFRLIITFI